MAREPFVPPCPRPSYSVDGNVGPLFCTIDDPLALAFYEKLAPHLFALGPDASPLQVTAAARRDWGAATGQELCNAYALAQHRWGWSFGLNPIESVRTRSGYISC